MHGEFALSLHPLLYLLNTRGGFKIFYSRDAEV